MNTANQKFTLRQYMIEKDFEFFHNRDATAMEIEYHYHDFYEIYFFISGKVTYLIEGKSYSLKPGDILLINNSELHRPVIEAGNRYERIVIWVKPEFLKQYSTEYTYLLNCFDSTAANRYNLLRPNVEAMTSIRNALAKFENSYYSNIFGSDVLRKLYLIEIIVYLNRVFLDMYDQDIDIDIRFNEKIKSIIEYINENIKSDLSLDFLSEKFFISKYHLLREFKKYTGYTIHQYIHKKRLIIAKRLLREGAQVTEVCVQCGFGDYSNFIRSFKRTFGISPKKYCKMHNL